MLEFLDKMDRLERRIARAIPELPPPRWSPSGDELGLLDFIPAISPGYESPLHMEPLAALFERAARGEAVRAVVSAPPRHGKTELELHAIAWSLLKNPALQVSFVGFAARFAEKKSRRARQLALKAGVPMAADSKSRQDWRTGVEEGGLWATSVDGPITGEGFGLMLVDDPTKDRAAAESAVQRDHVWEWFIDTAYTRLEPGGSCILTQTRWHPEDPAGRLIAQGWEYVSLPAINDAGEALWPGRWPVSELEKIRGQLGEYGWSSLYQGRPVPRGGSLFQDAHFYDALPTGGYRIGIGVDLAYTAKTQSDYSVVVILYECKGLYYVADVRRRQCQASEFAAAMSAVRITNPGASWLSYVSTTEKGIIDLLKKHPYNLPIRGVLATADKFVRAQPASAAWNSGKILLPRSAPWLEAFLSEVCGFTGVSDKHDDQVDALAGAFDVLAKPKSKGSHVSVGAGFDDLGVG